MQSLMVPRDLTLMVYDISDTKTNLKKIRAGIAGGLRDGLDLLLPAEMRESDFDLPLGLTHSWMAGGALYRLFGQIDEYRGFFSWTDALMWLGSVGRKARIKEVQIWGHGTPGRSWMLEDGCLDANSPTSKQYGDLLKVLRGRLTPEARIWFRNCSVFAGEPGHEFARKWTDFFQCRVSAHTHIINFWQAGLHTARPGIAPHWPVEEGRVNGVDGRAISTYSSPNRITCLHNRFPADW